MSLETLIFRATGFNSIRTLAARLSYYHAASNGLLSCLPLQLTLRGKSTIQSYRQPVYYVDLTLREGISLNDAITQAKKIDDQSKEAGFYQEAVDFIARKGFANARFEVNGEEGMEMVDEYFPEQEQSLTVEREVSSEGFVQDIQKGLKQSVRAVN